MISRRKLLKSGAAAAVIASVPFVFPRRSFAQSAVSFDYFISPKGDDNNAGTLASPWSITALNSKRATYAGKKIDIIGDQGVIQTGTVGGVHTTLFSIYQALTQATAPVLAVNGGTSGSPTYIGSCDSSGAYSARLAIIDCADPSTGNQPTNLGSIMGQSQYMGMGSVPNYGNITFDGLVLRNFTSCSLMFYCSSGQPANNLTVQNCELYNGQNVVSNGNPGAIYLNNANNAPIHNCKIHDLKTNGAGSPSAMQHIGVITFNSFNTNITNCTFYNCCALASKDGWQQMNVSYCYLGWGAFGSPYSGAAGTSNLGGTVQNYLTASGMTINFHHNILLGPILSYGESSQENEGSVVIYNNTFYEPTGYKQGLGALYNILGNAGGTWSFYNNLAYSLSGYAFGAGSLALSGALTTPSVFTSCDYNAYGTGMTFGDGYTAGHNGLALSAWQTHGFDAHSKTLSSSPFLSAPAEAITGSFAISGPATTAGKGGVACGALDGSGLVGCDFGGVLVPMAPSLVVS
jgi:hypothetical protein